MFTIQTCLEQIAQNQFPTIVYDLYSLIQPMVIHSFESDQTCEYGVR